MLNKTDGLGTSDGQGQTPWESAAFSTLVWPPVLSLPCPTIPQEGRGNQPQSPAELVMALGDRRPRPTLLTYSAESGRGGTAPFQAAPSAVKC